MEKKLDKIRGMIPGVIGIASDLVKFNKKYEQIITNLLVNSNSRQNRYSNKSS